MLNEKKKKSIYLPSHIKPIKYDLLLKPDLDAFIFTGKETIEIQIDKKYEGKLKKIIIHSKDIDIETVKIVYKKNNKNETQFSERITYNIENETATFYFKNSIPSDKCKLYIVFSGIINNSLRGFYRSQYKINGKTKYLATTQFEATDARRAFPCFDEPKHKAVFNVKLIIPGTHTAISNTLPIQIKKHKFGYKIIKFAPTPKMSTYLLAFIIGDFEWIEKKIKLSGKDVSVRIFTTKGKIHQAKFALDIAIKSIKFYNKYFDISYPLPTLDLIAIPDFESGAMENWGAVTFRETALLIDEENSSLSSRQWVAIVIAHELAHQWFGNLVTMQWWTDLWLNEGFASYMENFCINSLFPKWNVWDLNLAGRYTLALHLDSLNNSHPIEIKVNHPDEINEIFDIVSYAKGSAIIRMLAEYLGKEKFRNGLRFYLKKHSYKNTKTIDLWEAFEKISKKPVKKIMNTWTKQTGYPLVTFSNLNPNLGIMEQERFFSSRISRKENKINNKWDIPILFNNQKVLLNKKINKIYTKEKILKINKGERSFVRVKYSNDVLDGLRKQIQLGMLPTNDRLGIIRDLFALAEGGYIPTTTALDFSLFYKDETEYIVWSEIASSVNRLYNIISNEKFEENYKKYVLDLFSIITKNIIWTKKSKEKHSDVFLRKLILSQVGFYGDKNTIKKAQILFKKRNKSPIDANLRSTVYNIVSRTIDNTNSYKLWKQFHKLYLDENMHEEKERYGIALTKFKNKKILKKTLDFALSIDVRHQDAPSIIANVWQNRYGRELTWKFIQNNWNIILKYYGEGGHFLSKLLNPLRNHINKKDVISAKKFFKKNIAPGADRTLKQIYEKIYSNSAWLKDDKKIIEKWLNKNYK